MARKQNLHNALTRRELLKYGLYGGLAASLSGTLPLGGCSKRGRGNRYNVVLISIDTLRADHVSCYGYKHATTPNIDRLAGQGHLFSNAYTTIPSTLPAHASLFSSLYPRQLATRRNGEKTPAKATTLAETLESAGYATAAFVSTSIMNARYGLDQGFQTYNDVGKQTTRTAEETLAKATIWLENHKDESFFLFVHFFDPHTFYHAPDFFREKFGAPDRPMPPKRGFIQNSSQFTTEVIGKTIAAYDAEIAYADWALGRLMQTLEHLDLNENTLIVLLSDHGETLDELATRYGYFFDHGEFLYVHQLQIPMVIRMPAMVSQEIGIVHIDTVSIADIMPTILELLQIEPLTSIAGLSLLPILHGEKVSHGPVFSERQTFERAPKPYLRGDDYSIIEGKWHFIFSTVRDSELYNLLDDASEVSNLRHEREKTKTLKGKLYKWLKQVKPLFGPSKFETNKEALEQLRSLGYVE
jgi:arylsulfatase A-like enzyme